MQQRSFRILVAATIAAVVAAGYVLATGDRAVSRPPPGQRAMPGLADKVGELAWMRISRGSMKANFAEIGGRWTVVEKGNYPAAADRIRKLLLGLADLSLIEPKTDRAELLPRLDLDDPANGKATLVTVQDRTGALVGQLVIGRRRQNNIGSGEPGIYVRKPDTDQAWLARGALDASGDLLSWLDRRIISLPPTRIATFVATAADGTALILSRTAPDTPFAIDGLPENARPKDETTLAGPAAILENLDLDDVKPAAELPIPSSGVATAAFTTFDGLIVGLRLIEVGDTTWVAIDVTGFGKEAAEAEAKAVNDRLSRWSFAIPQAKAKLLRTTLGDLLRPEGS